MPAKQPDAEVPRLKHHAIIAGLYLVFTFGFVGSALILHHKAFAPAAPAGQAFVVAFTQDPKAEVFLAAQVNPNKPWLDSLTVKVKGPTRKPERWLLVVQCPQSRKPVLKQSLLYSEAVQPSQTSAIPVSVRSGAGAANPMLGCFTAGQANPGIAGVTLPALETDQAIESAQIAPMVYAARAAPTDPMDVLQVFPGCPLPGSSPAIATPTPVANVSPGCYSQAQSDAAISRYYLPSSVQTQEVLKYVNLTGYQTESMFPVPGIVNLNGGTGQNADEQYTWNGLSSLSPSLLVSNLAGAQATNRWTFDAGVLWGVAGATGVAFCEKLWNLYLEFQKRRAKKRAESNEAGDGSSVQGVTLGRNEVEVSHAD